MYRIYKTILSLHSNQQQQIHKTIQLGYDIKTHTVFKLIIIIQDKNFFVKRRQLYQITLKDIYKPERGFFHKHTPKTNVID